MRWTVKQVVDAVAGKQGSGVDALARVAGVSIDSRTLRRGELFIAIHGPSHDGHDYVAAVLEAGAVAAVVAEPVLSRYPGWMQDRCITVPDTLAGTPQSGTRRPQGLGQENLRHHRLRREDHYQRDPGGIAGHEATGPEVGRKF